jgi:hypothetical protein
MYRDVKYDKLDSNSFDSFDSDEPLLNPDNVKLELYTNDDANDDNDENNQQIQPVQPVRDKQEIKDNISRCIMRYHIANIIIYSLLFSILIVGYIDLKNYDTNNIVYTDYGVKLFAYYYYINFGWYLLYLLISLYLILYALWYNCCRIIRESTYFRMMKINYTIFTMNILTKMIFAFLLFMLTYHGTKVQIESIPVYYNIIVIESILHLVFSIHLVKLINIINLIDVY